MNEYIIANKTAILKEIAELKKQMKEQISHATKTGDYDYQFEARLDELNEVISQSTPLIPEIEKAFEQGQNSVDAILKCEEFGDMDWYVDKKITQSKQDYILNLKFDI